MIPTDTPAGMDNCGIAAVALLAGVSYAEAEQIFLRLCGKADMTTVWDRLAVLETLGAQVQEDVHYRNRPTLASWWEAKVGPSDHTTEHNYKVTMTGHVVAINKGLLFDQVFRCGIHPLRSPYKRKRVSSYQKVKQHDYHHKPHV
jgi:hypothetical protein